MDDKNRSLLSEEISKLPGHYRDTFSADFLTLIAAMRLHGFSILRADEAKEGIENNDELWPELSYPSIWLQARSAGELTDKLREAQSGTVEHIDLSNQLIRANLIEQHKLLELLEEFYEDDHSVPFYARLIVETIDQGESNLRPQGASTRLIMDRDTQSKWFREGNAELLRFAQFIVDKI